MANESIANERVKLFLADNLLADVIDMKASSANAHLELYQITKDKYDLKEAEKYSEQIKILLSARKVLLDTIE